MGVVLIVIALLAVFGGLAWATDYFFDPTLADIRDVVIIVYGVMGVLLLIVLLAVSVGIFIAVRMLTRKVDTLLDQPIRPALDEMRETARNVRAASEFYSDHAISPLIKVVAAARGARTGLSAVSRLRSRIPGQRRP
jgi:hypothetical protein